MIYSFKVVRLKVGSFLYLLLGVKLQKNGLIIIEVTKQSAPGFRKVYLNNLSLRKSTKLITHYIFCLYQRCPTHSPLATCEWAFKCGEWAIKCGKWLCIQIPQNRLFWTKQNKNKGLSIHMIHISKDANCMKKDGK